VGSCQQCANVDRRRPSGAPGATLGRSLLRGEFPRRRHLSPMSRGEARVPEVWPYRGRQRQIRARGLSSDSAPTSRVTSTGPPSLTPGEASADGWADWAGSDDSGGVAARCGRPAAAVNVASAGRSPKVHRDTHRRGLAPTARRTAASRSTRTERSIRSYLLGRRCTRRLMRIGTGTAA
jgi:hypothetical protein